MISAKKIFKYFLMFMPLAIIACSGESVSDNKKEGEVSAPDNQTGQAVAMSPVEFNNELTFMQEGILTQVDDLFMSDSGNIDLNLDNTLFELQLNLESLQGMEIPSGGEAFADAMIGLLEFYNAEFTGPFQDIVVLLKKSDWTDAEEKFVNDYDASFVETEKMWFTAVLTEQEKFAQANNIQLYDN